MNSKVLGQPALKGRGVHKGPNIKKPSEKLPTTWSKDKVVGFDLSLSQVAPERTLSGGCKSKKTEWR